MLDVAHMGLHVAQKTGFAPMRECFEMVTTRGAPVLGLEGYGLAPGCFADMVVLKNHSDRTQIKVDLRR